MVDRLSIYTGDGFDPYWNLAVEEYLTLHAGPGECILYLWQNRRTVVIGRNQNCWKECRIHTLEADGGHLARRLSGGGAVYHDDGNLNFTFCAREEDYNVDRQLEVLVRAARLLGIAAEKTGRNDVTADGRKFSGNAFYRTKGFCCHHGTLLVDTDKADMEKYLSVSREKLETKGVGSVRARVVNLRELNREITVAGLRERLIQAAGEVYGYPAQPFPKERLSREEIAARADFFASWDWKYGRQLAFQHSMESRFPWGGVELQFQVEGGVVRDVRAFSDGMEPMFIAGLPRLWRGCRYEAGALIRAMEQALEETPCGQPEESRAGENGQGEPGRALEKAPCGRPEESRAGENGQGEPGRALEEAPCGRPEENRAAVNGQETPGAPGGEAAESARQMRRDIARLLCDEL